MKCKHCDCAKKGFFSSLPESYVCTGVKEPFVISDINMECTEYEDRKDKKTYIEQVANMLGVKLLEEFKIRPSKIGKMLGYRENNETYRFDSDLVRKGYFDGWSSWYGGCSKELHYLILGLYEIDK